VSSNVKNNEPNNTAGKWFLVIIGSLIFIGMFGWEIFFITLFLIGLGYTIFIGLKTSNKETREKKKEELKKQIKIIKSDSLTSFEEKINNLEQKVQDLSINHTFTPPSLFWEKREFSPYEIPNKRNAHQTMFVEDLKSILIPNTITWLDNEKSLINSTCVYPREMSKSSIATCIEIAPISSIEDLVPEARIECDKDVKEDDIKKYFSEEEKDVEDYNIRRTTLIEKSKDLNKKVCLYNENKKRQWLNYKTNAENIIKLEENKFAEFSKKYTNSCRKQIEYFKNTIIGYEKSNKEDVVRRLNYIVGTIKLPLAIPHNWEIDFDPKENIAVIELELPDVVHNPPLKRVKLKNDVVNKSLNQSEKKEIIPNIHPAIILRSAYEIFRNDISGTIKLLVLNGWIEFDDPKTGINTKAYTASLMLEKKQIENINLQKIDPLTAFISLKGKSAGKLVEVVPITPVMSLNKKDKRFITTTEVLNKLGSETNLASMDWQDFESLIAELFEKEFAKEGAEVKVTQASRDRGVDAVIFDPDPIRGGKIIVQAKRYANTVDVSAVRDLCAVVKKEGAIKGILVTTSTYGGDAYQFANNEPVTLLNGAELLGLLKKHGYTFRINLEEAKKLNLANQNSKK
jgi:restriction system protein